MSQSLRKSIERLRTSSWRDRFWLTFLLALCIKFFLAWAIPITGDEAYYIMWGKYPALGYYDQPPMIGWIMSFVRLFGHSSIVLRLPAIALSLIVAPFLVDLLKDRDSNKAYLAGILFLIAPIHFLIVILSTDTPLVLFSFFCFYFFYRSIRESRLEFAAISGVFLGLAFLSKYFVVLLALSFLIYALSQFRRIVIWKSLFVCCLCSIPFLGLHLYWNSSHCWINLVFNFTGRNSGQVHNLENTKLFIKFQLYLVGPVLLYYFAKAIVGFRVGPGFVKKHSRDDLLFFFCFLIPIFYLGYSSMDHSEGLHWALSFYPYLYAISALILTFRQMVSAVKWTAAYTALHGIFVFGLLAMPVDYWKDQSFYRGLRMYLRAPELSELLESYSQDYHLASDGYTEAALLETFSSKRVHVFGEGVLFGRQDDLMTDYRELAGQNILVFTRHRKGLSDYERFFQTIEIKEIVKDDVIYSLFFGKGFKYEVYRDQVLSRVRSEYYQVPLLKSGSSCEIMDRYFSH